MPAVKNANQPAVKEEQPTSSDDEIVGRIKELIEENEAEYVGKETYLADNIPVGLGRKIETICNENEYFKCLNRKDIVFIIYNGSSDSGEQYLVFTKKQFFVCDEYSVERSSELSSASMSAGLGRKTEWYYDKLKVEIQGKDLKFYDADEKINIIKRSNKVVEFKNKDEMLKVYYLIQDIIEEFKSVEQ